MTYRPEIEGMRAISLLAAIFCHAKFSLFSGGYVGVDVFFVISGYLITQIILRDEDQKRFSLVFFYEKRIRRIVPPLLLVTLATLPFAWFYMLPTDMTDFSESVLSVVLFFSNMHFWQESGYFSAASELKPLLHTWSLGVEEQFYLLFPLFLVWTWRRGFRFSIAASCALFVVSLAVAVWAVNNTPVAAFYLLSTRMWELLAGWGIAILHRRGYMVPEGITSNLLGGLGLTLVVVPMFAYDDLTPFPGIAALSPVLGAALLLFCTAPSTWAHRWLSCGPLVGLGTISYSAYLWHQPLFAFRRYGGAVEPEPWVFLGLTGLTLVLAYISWLLVEKPFRNRKQMARNRVYSISAIGAVLLIGFALSGILSGGFPDRFSLAQQTMLAKATPSPKRDECHTGGTDYLAPANACTYFTPTPRWAVLGDSHAVEISYALADELRGQGDGVLQLSFSSCPPRWSSDTTDPCARWVKEAVATILARPEIENVVLSYRMAWALHGEHLDHYPDLPDEIPPAQQQDVLRSYEAIQRTLVDAGRNVVLVLQAPELRYGLRRLIRDTADFVDGNMTSVPRSWWLARTADISEWLKALPVPVLVVDPADLFCKKAVCFASLDGRALYYNEDHMSLYGARLVARELLRQSQVHGASLARAGSVQ
ncbi:MAG: acyltransferase [Alphaproteobacteria bacterium]|nr:acyltransferase [Alphaproteobacteria bacterium]